MALIEVLADSSSSPRISFSHDLAQYDVVPVEHHIRTTSSSIDFDFCVFRETFDHESASADELFFDGKILPIQIKKRLPPPTRAAAPPLPPLPPEKQSYKTTSFWRFKRSSSLNCGNGYARTLCPLPLLSRSNSTGSTSSSVKRSSHKPPLKKTNGVKINPALNVTQANLFGFGSIFSGGKDRSRKK